MKKTPYFLLLLVLLISFSTFQGMATEGINPLRFGEDKKSWQLTVNFSRSVDTYQEKRKRSTGLWEVEGTSERTLVGLQSSFDLNQTIGLRGGISVYSNSLYVKKTNLWTGIEDVVDSSNSGVGGASLKLKFDIWENSEFRTYFLIPVLGGSASAGVTWTRDPIMIFPRFTLLEGGFGLDSKVSFVANTRVALTGSLSFSMKNDESSIGVSGGMVYRKGQYDGAHVTASVRRGDSVEMSLKFGLSYGEEG